MSQIQAWIKDVKRRMTIAASLVFTLVLAVLSASPALADTTAWTTSGNNLPTGAFYASTATDNGYIYQIGGQDSGIVAKSDVYYAHAAADGSIGSWSTGNSLPATRYGASAVVANGYIYLIGGFDGTTGFSVSTIYYAQLNSDGSVGSWSTASNPMTKALSYETASVVNGELYVMGGQTTSSNGVNLSSSVYYAPLNTDGSVGSWTTSNHSLPQNSRLASAVTANGYLYYMGGDHLVDPVNGFVTLSTVYYAPVNTDGSVGTWSTSSNSLPAALYGAASVVVGGNVYELGGISNYLFQSTDYYASLNTDGTVGAWSTSSNPLPAARADVSAVTVNGYIYVVGGSGGHDDGAKTTFYAATPTDVPPGPTNLTAASPSLAPTLNWDTVSGATSYNVYRDGTQLTSTTTNSYVDKAASVGTHSYYVTAVINGTESSPSNTVSVVVPAPVQAVDVGGSGAGAYAADTGFSGGSTYSSGASVDTSSLVSPAPQEVYQTVRYGNSFGYTLSGLTPGANYTLRLHFNELYWGTPSAGGGGVGSRVFDVAVNGQAALTNFDIFKTVGGANTAIVEDVPTTADSNGIVAIQFTADTDNAMVNGIELYDGTLPSEPPAPTISSAHINAGDGAAGSFSADEDFNGGQTYASSASVDTSGVANPAPQAVYQSVRYGGNFTYGISHLSPNTSYVVRLHFNELYWGTALASNQGGVGSRVFNVAINGSPVLNNFDVYQTTGGANKAIEEDFTVQSDSSGNIFTQFTTNTDNAMVSGIEVTTP